MRRRLCKWERVQVYQKMGGHCAYCGYDLKYKDMQVDHVIALRRGGADTLDNMLPACRSCNYYKDTLTIEGFRDNIARLPTVLMRDNVTYKIAVRFGTVHPNPHKVKFYFEKVTDSATK